MNKLSGIQRLTLFYLMALLSIFLLLAGGQTLIQYALHQEVTSRLTASTIGKSRGRAASVIIDVSLMHQYPEKQQHYLADIHSVLVDWEQVQQDAYTGNFPASLPGNVVEQITRSKYDYDTMHAAILTLFLKKPASPESVLYVLLEHGPTYQSAMLSVYDTMNTQADIEVQQVQKIELFLFIGTLLTILLEYLFVFREATRQLRTQLQKLQKLQIKESV